jgi:hypothetical protein
LFILVGTTTKSIQFIKNQCFCFDLFHVIVLLLLAKQQQQKWIFRIQHKNRALQLFNKKMFVIANKQKKQTAV